MIAKKRAILVNIVPHFESKEAEMKNFEELTHLVTTYGGVVILKILQKRGRPSASTFLGSGKALEVKKHAEQLSADLIIVNDFLKPNQANNLRKILKDKVLWDRFELILKIFEKHAPGREAQLQIELARLKYEFPKLVNKGKSLSQQAGHVGLRGGAGEKLLEVKRRHLRDHIKNIERKLENLRKVQAGQRDRRRKSGFKLAALVGYTNSGKSTIFKALTEKPNVLISNILFATLSTKIGKLIQEEGKIESKILISDTIGFIKNLPHVLFSSFLATLEEVKNADLLLHVIDISDPELENKIITVNQILTNLKCDQKPQILIFNKTDLSNNKNAQNSIKKLYKNCQTLMLSALNKEDTDQLKKAIIKKISIQPQPSLA